jgi:AcrR family transcriptional regulator
MSMPILNTHDTGAFRHSRVSRAKGRPRNAAADHAILDAARQLILEHGFNNLRLEHVAARAGIGKPSLYRRWASKYDLAFDLLLELAEHESVIDLGDTRAELLAAVNGSITSLTLTDFGPILRAVLSEVVIQADLDDPYRPRIEQARRATVTAVVRRGVARGDLAAAADTDIAMELLVGPVFFRLLFGGDLDDAFAETVVDAFLRAFELPPQ